MRIWSVAYSDDNAYEYTFEAPTLLTALMDAIKEVGE